MRRTNLEAVENLMDAINGKNVDAALSYFDPSVIQHDPHIADGVDGIRSYIRNSSSEELQLRKIRTIKSGDHVVAQLKAEPSGDDIFSVYRFQNGLVAEHWAFFSACAPPNKSGHTQEDGPVQAKHLEDSVQNVDFAREYYKTFHLAGDRSSNDEFFTGDLMIRHEPNVHDGLGEFLRDVETLMQHRTIDEMKLLLGEGDLVFIAAKGTHEGKPSVYIDLYRIDNRKIVEHWGFPQLVPPRSEWKNANGPL